MFYSKADISMVTLLIDENKLCEQFIYIFIRLRLKTIDL